MKFSGQEIPTEEQRYNFPGRDEKPYLDKRDLQETFKVAFGGSEWGSFFGGLLFSVCEGMGIQLQNTSERAISHDQIRAMTNNAINNPNAAGPRPLDGETVQQFTKRLINE